MDGEVLLPVVDPKIATVLPATKMGREDPVGRTGRAVVVLPLADLAVDPANGIQRTLRSVAGRRALIYRQTARKFGPQTPMMELSRSLMS